MCHYQPFEDDSPPSPTEDHAQSTRNDTNHVVLVPGWHLWRARIAVLETRIALLETRIALLELRLELEAMKARNDQLKAQLIMSVLILVTLVYASCNRSKGYHYQLKALPIMVALVYALFDQSKDYQLKALLILATLFVCLV